MHDDLEPDAQMILRGLYLGSGLACWHAWKKGFKTLCVLESPCRESCEHIPIIGETTPLGIPLRVDRDRLKEAVAWIHATWKNGEENVLVHCAAGHERSPLTVAHFLMDLYQFNLDEAYAFIRQKRPQIEDRREWLPLLAPPGPQSAVK